MVAFSNAESDMVVTIRHILKNVLLLTAFFVVSTEIYVTFFLQIDPVESSTIAAASSLPKILPTNEHPVMMPDLAAETLDLHDVVDLKQARRFVSEDSQESSSFSALIAAALDKAVKKAVTEIRTPQERLSEALLAIYGQIGVGGNPTQTVRLLQSLDASIECIEMSVWQSGRGDADVIADVVRRDARLRALSERFARQRSAAVDDQATFLLYAVIESRSPLATLKEIREYRILECHRLHGTFEQVRQFFSLLKTLSAHDALFLRSIVDTPRFDLWRSAYAPNGSLQKTLNGVNVGGTLIDLSVETNAANIVKGNKELRKLIKRYSRSQ